ncbi:MAG TPA: hypothetical protein VJH03_12305 [Blastocatellia bacterium]|nr:hypothetical protein [Blastocatellia bacterium]
MSIPKDKLNPVWWALRIGLGAGPLLAGLDKFFNILTNWEKYLNPMAERLLPISGATFMHVVGVIEMIVGLAILTRWTRIGSYVASLWLVLIAVNLILAGAFLDVAVRDLLMALAAYTLARLTEARQPATNPLPVPLSGHTSYSVLAR